MTAALQHELLWSPLPRRYLAVVECAMPPGEQPCTQVQCRYHLAHTSLGDHRTRPTRDCALTVANEGPRTLDQVAEVFGLSGERIRQIEERAIDKLKSSASLRRLFDESD
ncbi:MAG TPA: sigma factor-like helix-turn-helix DNA-binding protein [Polyangiaceae bacterium]|nr:sigma factor-like helix-turn-helix DNA-binding protein [Polyangiaceae bacterium]